FEPKQQAPVVECYLLRGGKKRASDACLAGIGKHGDRIQPRHAAAGAIEHHAVADRPALDLGDPRIGSLARNELAKRTPRDTVRLEGAVLDGDETVYVGVARWADLGRHAEGKSSDSTKAGP